MPTCTKVLGSILTTATKWGGGGELFSGVREMTQQLKVLVALAENAGSVPSAPNMGSAIIGNSRSREYDPSDLQEHQAHIGRTYIHEKHSYT